MGPKFAVQPTKKNIPVARIIADVDQIIRSNKDKYIHNEIRGKVATIITNHITKTSHITERKQFIINNAYKKTEIFLKNHPESGTNNHWSR